MPARLIYLFGIDGSGKTTVAQYIEQCLRAENCSVKYVWATLHPLILRPVAIVAKFVLVRHHSKFDNYPEHIRARNEGVRRFRFLLKPLFYLGLLDYYPQYLWKVVRTAARNDCLICDRYYVDMLMERAILQSLSPEQFPDWLRRYGHFFRAPDLALYLRTSPAVAMQRKTDIPSLEYLRERAGYYDAAAAVLGAHVVDADLPLPLVLTRIRENIGLRDG